MGSVRVYGENQREAFELTIDSFKVRQQLTRELYARWGFQKIQVRLERSNPLYTVTKLKDAGALCQTGFPEGDNEDTCVDDD